MKRSALASFLIFTQQHRAFISLKLFHLPSSSTLNEVCQLISATHNLEIIDSGSPINVSQIPETMAERSSTTIKQPQPTLTFDEHGDLLLVVGSGNTEQQMIVDSHALCRSSVVFRKMLSGNFLEAKPRDGDWQVKLPDDKPNPFAVLMDIIHGNYDRAPETPALKLFYEVTVLTNKYDMTRALRPVMNDWFIGPKWGKQVSLSFTRLSHLLFISWEVGYAETFCWVANKVADLVAIDESGRLVDSKNRPLEQFAGLSDLDILGECRILLNASNISNAR